LLLTIEKLIYGGDGLARLPDDSAQSEDRRRGKAVFIPFVLSGEQIEASLVEQRPGFARGRADSIVYASPHRINPPCPYFAGCGGCHYQHADYEHQLEIKKEILRENLRRIAKLELSCEIQVHPSPPWNYRNRSRLQVRTKLDFTIGYYKVASHEVLPIEECPISSPLINRGIAALWQVGRSIGAIDGPREVEFFANAEDTALLVEIICSPDVPRSAVRSWAEQLSSALPEITGVVAVRGNQEGELERVVAVGAAEITYRTANKAFRVSAGSFFQTNRFLTNKLIEVVTNGRSGELALDLYAGVGLFSTALACDYRHIISVESSQTAANDLAYNLPQNATAVCSATGQYLSTSSGAVRAEAGDRPAQSHGIAVKGRIGKGKLPQEHLHTPDLIVVDPPRGGLGDRVARALAEANAPRVTYVSCDPATLARDLMPLLASGYKVEEAHLVDMFPQTYHIETVLHLVK
jgi:23S rRNA (uracil1939-C5)-methyltransferase